MTVYLVDHSAPDAVALLVEAEGKRLFYTGDLRGHGRKKALFGHLLNAPPKDIDYLLLEGTMLSRGNQEFPDEDSVENALAETFAGKGNLAFLFCSSQNVDRVVSAYRAALKTDSLFVIDLYTAYVLKTLGVLSPKLPQFDWRNVRVKYWRSHAQRLADAGHKEFLYEAKRKKIEVQEIIEKRHEAVMLVRANSLFTRMAAILPTTEGINLVWSMWPGYLTPDNPVVRFSEEHGLTIRTVHTSGHATAEDLKRLAVAVNPRAVIPIHTEHPELYPTLYPKVLRLEDGVNHAL